MSLAMRQIQKDYFELLRQHFVAEQREFKTSGLTSAEFTSYLATKAITLPIYAPNPRGTVQMGIEVKCQTLLAEISAFWESRAETVVRWIADSEALCVLHTVPVGGLKKRIRRAGLYFDTACVIDPLYLNPASSLRRSYARGEGFPFLLVLPTFFDLLSLESLFTTDCEPPIAILYPAFSCRNVAQDVEIEHRCSRQAMQIVGDLFNLPSRRRRRGAIPARCRPHSGEPSSRHAAYRPALRRVAWT